MVNEAFKFSAGRENRVILYFLVLFNEVQFNLTLYWLGGTLYNMRKEPKKSCEYVAFDGKKFLIEWYFDAKGSSSALDYFESLSEDEQMKLLGLFELMGNIGTIKNETKFRHEGDKIYAFKPQPHRFLCFFFTGQKIVVTNAFHKKTDKLPIREKERALKIKESYELRVKTGDYYE